MPPARRTQRGRRPDPCAGPRGNEQRRQARRTRRYAFADSFYIETTNREAAEEYGADVIDDDASEIARTERQNVTDDAEATKKG
jgi:hypothetical protein